MSDEADEIELVDGPASMEAPAIVRPSMRGSFHRAAIPVAVVLTALLTLRTSSGGALATVIVYGVCVTAMLATSGIYHSPRLAHLPRRLLRRLDHSMILVGIAGTYTAVIVLALDGATRVVLLVLAWTLAVIGVGVRMLWMDAPSGLVALVYLLAGWQLMVDLPAYVRGMSGAELALLAVGGVLYTVGAIVYALKRPNPWPRVFGYHEVFHSLVIAAAFTHWVAVYLLAG
ncbi:MAG: hemolysin III family protein [Actinomycetota bacterium]|nr:hemolysin III family protein [Actinomycetota bacterium]